MNDKENTASYNNILRNNIIIKKTLFTNIKVNYKKFYEKEIIIINFYLDLKISK